MKTHLIVYYCEDNAAIAGADAKKRSVLDGEDHTTQPLSLAMHLLLQRAGRISYDVALSSEGAHAPQSSEQHVSPRTLPQKAVELLSQASVRAWLPLSVAVTASIGQ